MEWKESHNEGDLIFIWLGKTPTHIHTDRKTHTETHTRHRTLKM
jgi:hypothetical protein